MASIADRMAGMAHGGGKGIGDRMMPQRGAAPSADTGEHTQVHDHGDGTFHTVAGGQKTEHPSFGHMAMHLAAHHSSEANHSHVMHHPEGHHTSHHMKEGSVSGPHEHQSGDEMAEHMKEFAGDGESGGGGYSGGNSPGQEGGSWGAE